MIRTCISSDAAKICDIYNFYVRETVVTFEETPISVEEMTGRIDGVKALLPWIVWDEAGDVAGYAYATPWKARSAYRYSVECSIYLAPDATRQGIGTKLYEALIAELKPLGVHCVIGGAALPNPGSVALHARLGFTQVAEFREVGWKHQRWISVAYWQKFL